MIADFSTDGKWCYVVLWVVPRPISLKVDWESLKNRLLSACPSCLPKFYLNQSSNSSQPPPLYLLKVFSLDRKGLLHGNSKNLSPCQLFKLFSMCSDMFLCLCRCYESPV